jgi:condensin complex subunit 1
MTPESMQDLQSARALMRYYGDATRFCLIIQSAVPTLCDLLASTTKIEVVEAMNFFVIAKGYGMEFAEVFNQ